MMTFEEWLKEIIAHEKFNLLVAAKLISIFTYMEQDDLSYGWQAWRQAWTDDMSRIVKHVLLTFLSSLY